MDRNGRAHGSGADGCRPPRRVSNRALGAVVALLVSLACVGALGPNSVSAATGDVGYEGASFTGTGTPTGLKRAESVLWWNDGVWWANMWDTGTNDFHIFRLDTATQTWVDTGVPIDTRANTHADVLWDGAHLYVASHLFTADETPAVPGFASYLFRFSYDAATDTYSRDPGYPVLINNYRTETLVIDKDSSGKLWATWQQGNTIYLNRTNGDDASWGTPFPLPANGANVTVDDISSLIAFGGNKIGVLWSNQTGGANNAMWFAVHVDGEPDDAWEESRTAIQGAGFADDHVNLKSLQADSSGRVYAAIKTEHTTSSAPLIMLLVRDPSTGDWASHVFGRVAQCHNRPIVLIDEEHGVLHMFATGPASPAFTCSSSGGAIYEKTSPLEAISFEPGYGTVVLQDADSDRVQNTSSTKQNLTSATGLVLLAVNSATARYWHHYDALGGSPPPPPPPPPPPAPTADFACSPTTGTAPLAVTCTDLSSDGPVSWAWEFGDGGTSSTQNPSHTYQSAGTYTVSLTATNASGGDGETKVDYVTVAPPPPDFTLGASPSSRTIVRGNSTTYTVTVTPTNGFGGAVDLSVSGLPSETTASFSTNPVSVPPAGVSTLTVSTTATSKQGGYTLTITGTSGSLVHTALVALQVKRK